MLFESEWACSWCLVWGLSAKECILFYPAELENQLDGKRPHRCLTRAESHCSEDKFGGSYIKMSLINELNL